MLKKVIITISFFLGITVGTLLTSALIYYNIFTSMSETTLRIIVTIGTTVFFVLMSLLFSDRFVAMLKRIEDRLSRTPKNCFHDNRINSWVTFSQFTFIRS